MTYLKAIDEIGWTPYHWYVRSSVSGLCFLFSERGDNYFSIVKTNPAHQETFRSERIWVGDKIPNLPTFLKLIKCSYAVDSQLLLLQRIIATQASYEFNPSYSRALTIAVYVGMLAGAVFWGLGADVIGRRFAFNVSLFICSIFTIAAGAAPNWVALASLIALLGFGGGGNIIMDTTVFIEYLPSNKQWVLSAPLPMVHLSIANNG